jgi:hypothetical protein
VNDIDDRTGPDRLEVFEEDAGVSAIGWGVSAADGDGHSADIPSGEYIHSVEKYVSFLKYAYLPHQRWSKWHVGTPSVHDDLFLIRVLERLAALDSILGLRRDRCAPTKSSNVASHD